MAQIDMSKVTVGTVLTYVWRDYLAGDVTWSGPITSVRNRGDGTVSVWFRDGKHSHSIILLEDGSTQKRITLQ
jgi:hypothetical protein